MLANIETAQLRELSFTHTFSTRCLAFGQEFLTKTINFSNVRVCPFCFQEHQSIPFTNSLLAKTFCTKHGIPLVAIHPDTGRKLTWATHYLWRDAPTWIPQISAIDICEAELTINEQLEKLANNSLGIVDQVLVLAEYCDLLEFFARFHQVAFGSSAKTKYEFSSSRNYYAPAHWYIKEWPIRYYELLDHFESHPMASSRLTGVRKCFRDLYDDVYSPENKNSGAYKLLKSGFEQYLKHYYSNGLLMSSLSIVSDEVKTESKYISKEETANILDCHISRVKLYIREGLLSFTKTLDNNIDIFKREEVLKLKSKLRNCFTLKQCANCLSVSTYHARQLLQASIINPVIAPSKSNRDWLIDKSEIEQLIKSLIKSAEENITAKTSAIKRFTFSKVNLANLVSDMLSNNIKFGYVSDKEKPFSLMQFTPIFDANDPIDSNFVSPAEAIHLLGVNKNAIYDFIKLGYLEYKKINVKRTPRSVTMILRNSVVRFKALYRFSRQLKDQNEGNFILVSGPKIDGCCVNVYRKSMQ